VNGFRSGNPLLKRAAIDLPAAMKKRKMGQTPQEMANHNMKFKLVNQPLTIN